jgi:hypothetical protein
VGLGLSDAACQAVGPTCTSHKWHDVVLDDACSSTLKSDFEETWKAGEEETRISLFVRLLLRASVALSVSASDKEKDPQIERIERIIADRIIQRSILLILPIVSICG